MYKCSYTYIHNSWCLNGTLAEVKPSSSPTAREKRLRVTRIGCINIRYIHASEQAKAVRPEKSCTACLRHGLMFSSQRFSLVCTNLGRVEQLHQVFAGCLRPVVMQLCASALSKIHEDVPFCHSVTYIYIYMYIYIDIFIYIYLYTYASVLPEQLVCTGSV